MHLQHTNESRMHETVASSTTEKRSIAITHTQEITHKTWRLLFIPKDTGHNSTVHEKKGSTCKNTLEEKNKTTQNYSTSLPCSSHSSRGKGQEAGRCCMEWEGTWRRGESCGVGTYNLGMCILSSSVCLGKHENTLVRRWACPLWKIAASQNLQLSRLPLFLL